MKNTFDGFVAGVKQQYEVAKNGMYSGYLLNPSPAQLRNLCLLLLENNWTKSDEEVFKIFFQVSEGKGLRKAIENFDIEKFRPICNFLKGKSEKTNPVGLNLIAILVEYQPRPFNKYLKVNANNSLEVLPEEKEEMQSIKTFDFGWSEPSAKEDISIKSIFNGKWSRIGAILLFVLGSGYILNQKFFPKKECMQWQKNHYEKVDCSAVQQGIISSNEIMPIDNRLINLQKIEVNQQTQFFKNGEPLVYYSKSKGKVSFFNSYGINPETGKPLKPITQYMIDKYVLNQ